MEIGIRLPLPLHPFLPLSFPCASLFLFPLLHSLSFPSSLLSLSLPLFLSLPSSLPPCPLLSPSLSLLPFSVIHSLTSNLNRAPPQFFSGSKHPSIHQRRASQQGVLGVGAWINDNARRLQHCRQTGSPSNKPPIGPLLKQHIVNSCWVIVSSFFNSLRESRRM